MYSKCDLGRRSRRQQGLKGNSATQSRIDLNPYIVTTGESLVCGCGGVGVLGARRAALHFLQRLCDASAITLRQRLEKIHCCSYSATTLRKRDQQKGYYAAAPESGPKIWDIWSFRTHVNEAQNLSRAGLSRGCRRGATDNIPGLQTMLTQGCHSKSE